MRFFDKRTVGQLNTFSQNDLLQYVEYLMKESTDQQPTEGNYSWLKTKHIHHDVHDYAQDLDAFKPMVSKMTPEMCASIAVKLDSFTNVSTTDVLANFKRLLLEQHSIQTLQEGVTRAKNRRRNRVQPDLGERQPMVSFILD